MSDNAVMKNNIPQSLQKAIDDSLSSELQICSKIDYDAPRVGRWVTFSSPSISLITRGKAKTEFRTGDMLNRVPGRVYFFPANTWRRSVIDNPKGAGIGWCRCYYTVFNGFNLLLLYDVPLSFAPDCTERFAWIHEQLLELEHTNDQSPFEIACKRKELCFSLLSLILSQSELKPEAFKRINQMQRFAPVVKYMNKHFQEEVCIDVLAEIACLSKSQFHRQFKAALSTAPYEYLKKLRIKNAVSLLTHSDSSIQEIGEKCGWNDQFHFSRIFKAAMGIAPGKYREKLRADFDTFIAGF